MSNTFPYIAPDPGRVNCRACSRYNVEGCATCGMCTSHCMCRDCPACGRSHPRSICRTCHNCRRSGRCKCNGKPGAIDLSSQFATPYAPEKQARLRRGIGAERSCTVELEVSDYLQRERGFLFSHICARPTTDGSITGAHPMEMILGPIPEMAWAAAMEEITAWVTRTQAQVNETCGMHVHVDARDFGGYELRRLIQLYHILEPTFYSLVQPNRATRRYCRALTTDEWRDLLHCTDETRPGRIREAILLANYARGEQGELRGAATAGGEYRAPRLARAPSTIGPRASAAIRAAKTAAAGKYDSSRYRGFNLHSWFHRGTIEFRQHEGCVLPERIEGWMQWCKWVVEMASRLRDVEVAQIRTPEDFLTGVWKKEYGLLALPEAVVEFVRRGRDPEPYGHVPWVRAVSAVEDVPVEPRQQLLDALRPAQSHQPVTAGILTQAIAGTTGTGYLQYAMTMPRTTFAELVADAPARPYQPIDDDNF